MRLRTKIPGDELNIIFIMILNLLKLMEIEKFIKFPLYHFFFNLKKLYIINFKNNFK